jgi:hypothetical protein
MCYERRRAEACVDESAHHALFVYYCSTLSLTGPSTKRAGKSADKIVPVLGKKRWRVIG